MNATEHPVRFACGDDTLVGIVHRTAVPSDIGIVIVVGGPQYRIGSHRHFVELARELAGNGIPVFRFDVRGMGDSSGIYLGFEGIDDDIAAAVDLFIREEPQIKHVVLWGLCDGASASIFYAARDLRVRGLILLNPWIRSETSYARTKLTHYYGAKILDGTFWRRLIFGEVDVRDAVSSLIKRLLSACGIANSSSKQDELTQNVFRQQAPLSEQMASGMAAFQGETLLIISGNDLTAKEFDDVTRRDDNWKRMLSADRVSRHDLEDADHTFSRADWKAVVNNWTVDWVNKLHRVERAA